MESDHDSPNQEKGEMMIGSGGSSPSPAASSSSSRWNPTKEQIGILEGLYGQGIRTPTAEQIQQITSRLRAHGHIEGKNVFYWFQNHKARQRQKEKQESMAFFNRYFLANNPPPPPPFHLTNNGACGPYYVAPGSDVGALYTQTQYPKPKVQLFPCGGGIKRRHRSGTVERTKTFCRTGPSGSSSSSSSPSSSSSCAVLLRSPQRRHDVAMMMRPDNNQETLDLFPLHPTGSTSSERTTKSSETMNSITTVLAEECSSPDNRDHHHPNNFFDFFSAAGTGSGFCSGSCERN